MDRIFSVEELSDQFWSSPPPIRQTQTESSIINRSSSEWALQIFLEEAAASSAAVGSVGVANGENDNVVIEINDQVLHLNQNANTPRGDPQTTSLNSPSNIPIDSKDYQAFLKSRLNLACAAVALSRGSSAKPQDLAGLTDSGSQASSQAPQKGSGYDTSRGQYKDAGGPLGIPSLPAMQKKSGVHVHVKPTTSDSSGEQSDEDELDGDTEVTDNMDPSDVKRVKRMLSNRESARRSRRRKQAHLTELETQVSQSRVENSSLLKRFTDISQKYNVAAVDNRVLKADVETLRAKVKMAEETVKRVTGLNPLFQAISEVSTIGMPSFQWSPSDTSTDAAVPVQDERNHQFYHFPSNNPMSTQDPIVNNDVVDISSVDNVQQNPAAVGGKKDGKNSFHAGRG